MSSVSKSKLKGKKADKESAKSSSKSLVHPNNNAVPNTGYNPLLGKFHTFEEAPLPSANLHHVSGRFLSIDDTDDHNGSSVGLGIEYDSVSNNGSWSGESEDHKEKVSQTIPRQESVPGAESDKREKIRQKNERKHQRQKERRAQELREKCIGYLMSRKLEALGQQLVAMGFSQERATMALILNEGRVEESVAWLFEEAEDERHKELNLDGGGNLKIDISEELARVSDIEIKYKASKQEVERIVVSCEGDLDMAEETLKAQKQEHSAASKPEETGDPPTVAKGDFPYYNSQNASSLQARPTSNSSSSIQQKRDEKDFNYTKAPVMAVSSADPGTMNMQISNRIKSKMEWPKPQQIAVPSEKRWPVSGSNTNVSNALASSLQASPLPAKTEAHYVNVGNDLKNLQLGSVREPVIVMQRRQSVNTKQGPSSSMNMTPGTAMGWYPNTVESVKPNGVVPPVAVTRSPSPNGLPPYSHLHYQSQKHSVPGIGSIDSQGTTGAGGLWSRAFQSPAIAPASSLGLFSGQGVNSSSGSLSPVDWTSGCSTIDYSNIDWSLDRGLLSKTPKEFWADPNYVVQNKAGTYDSVSYGPHINSTRRPVLSNLNGGAMPGWQDRVGSSDSSVGSNTEWTSPFEEKDLFSLPRLFVSSPSP